MNRQSQNKLKVVFLGTPTIACNALEDFIKSEDIEICAVVTQPDKPAGRGHQLTPPPIKLLALENNVEVFQPVSIRKDVELIEKLKSLEPDFFITIAFGQILSQEVLDIPKHGTINLHASLLPKYRGANPIARAIADGEAVSGVCTMLTSIGVDEGDVILTEKIEIEKNMTTDDLTVRISEIAPEILRKSLYGIYSGTITPQKQDNSQATFAPKFSKEETFLDFSKPALQLHNLVRALYPKPAANTNFDNIIVKIMQTEVVEQKVSAKNGEVVKIDKNGLYVATGENLLLIKTLKPSGKKEMPAYAWSCGVAKPIIFH